MPPGSRAAEEQPTTAASRIPKPTGCESVYGGDVNASSSRLPSYGGGAAHSASSSASKHSADAVASNDTSSRRAVADKAKQKLHGDSTRLIKQSSGGQAAGQAKPTAATAKAAMPKPVMRPASASVSGASSAPAPTGAALGGWAACISDTPVAAVAPPAARPPSASWSAILDATPAVGFSSPFQFADVTPCALQQLPSSAPPSGFSAELAVLLAAPGCASTPAAALPIGTAAPAAAAAPAGGTLGYTGRIASVLVSLSPLAGAASTPGPTRFITPSPPPAASLQTADPAAGARASATPVECKQLVEAMEAAMADMPDASPGRGDV